METMLAAVFKGDGVLSVETIAKPVIKKSTDVLIKIGAASICGSDLHVLAVPPGQFAKPGTVMGHEFFGYVESIGSDVSAFNPGDCVVVDNVEKCHTCIYCKSGMDNLCPDAEIYGQTKHGGFAQYAVIPESQLLHMNSSIPSYLAAQTEPLACVMNAMTKLNPTPMDTVAILGMGPIGLTFVRTMKLYGVKHLIVCETSEVRRQKALECGADLALDPTIDNIPEKILEKCGCLCNIVVDAVGIGPIFPQALDILKCGGRLLIFGQNSNAVSQVKPAIITRNELTVMGSYCPHNTFLSAINLLENKNLGLEKIISHKLELPDILKGIELLKSQQASRVIIYPNGIK